MLEENKEIVEEHDDELSSEQEEERAAEMAEEKPADGSDVASESEPGNELNRVQQEAKENYDRFLRVYAEFENYKKRMERDRSELIKYSNEHLIKELLPVVDNFQRAIDEARKHSDAESVVQGLEMILKQFREVLDRAGVKPIRAMGETFDPNFHEAMMHEVSDEHDENIVIDEFQQGYVYKDRLLRPSMVKVSKKSGTEADVDLQSDD